MEESNIEGVATHGGPESCVDVREDGGRDELRELAPNRASSSAIRARSSAINAACEATSASSSA